MDEKYLDSITESSSCRLEEYKYVYPRLMKTFTSQFEDFNELTFIKREIENHLTNIESKKNAMSKCIDFYHNGEKFNTNEEFLIMMSSLEKMIASHDAIISFLETNKQTLQTSIKKIQTDTKENIFTNNFDSVNETKVYNYFKCELADKKLITLNTLNEYLILAFQNTEIIPDVKFNFLKKENKASIIKIFYNYYSIIVQSQYGRQDEYIKLLTNYFSGFEFQKVKNNFSG